MNKFSFNIIEKYLKDEDEVLEHNGKYDFQISDKEWNIISGEQALDFEKVNESDPNNKYANQDIEQVKLLIQITILFEIYFTNI